MIDDIVIGERPPGPVLASGVYLRKINDGPVVFHNAQAFLVYDGLFGAHLKIYKDTPEATELAALLKTQGNDHEVSTWLNLLVLRRMDLERVLDLIKQTEKHHFGLGRKHQASLMRQALHP